MNQAKRHEIYIYDHPESKIRFLEQTLAGKDWRAKLVYPDGTQAERQLLAQAKAGFIERGYLVQEQTNADGQRILEIHHLGEGSVPSEIIREMGLSRGLGHLVMNPSLSLEATFAKGKQALSFLEKKIKDPAHLNGMIYILAEAFLMSPEKVKAKLGEAAGEAAVKPGNTWRKLGFFLFFAQSATYLFAAKDNDTTSFDEFRNKIKRTLHKGGDLTHVQFNETDDKPSQGFGQTVLGLLRRYPIEAGALFNNLGMLLYIAGTLKARSHYSAELAHNPASEKALEYLKKGTGFLGLKNAGGFYHDMRGALTSIVAWTLMLIPAKKKEEIDEHTPRKNIFTRMWNAIAENPQVGTGLLTLASSSQRLQGANIRERMEPGSATNQIRGEKIYIAGDVMLMFTKNDHYGKKTGNVDTLANTLADYINKMPLILGPTKQEEMVRNMSDFLLQKGLSDIKHKPKTASFTPEELKQRADLLVLEVGRRVRNSYGEQMEQLGDVAARLVCQFPKDRQPAVVEALSKGLAQIGWIYATPEEIKPVLEHSITRLPASSHAAVTNVPTMKSLRQSVADITAIQPEVKDASAVAILYDALTPCLAPASPTPAISSPVAEGKPVTTVTQASRVAPLTTIPATLAHA
jgi:hypothetical protein